MKQLNCKETRTFSHSYNYADFRIVSHRVEQTDFLPSGSVSSTDVVSRNIHVAFLDGTLYQYMPKSPKDMMDTIRQLTSMARNAEDVVVFKTQMSYFDKFNKL